MVELCRRQSPRVCTGTQLHGALCRSRASAACMSPGLHSLPIGMDLWPCATLASTCRAMGTDYRFIGSTLISHSATPSAGQSRDARIEHLLDLRVQAAHARYLDPVH